MMFRKAFKKTPKAPKPFTVHVDKAAEPLCMCATKQEAFEAVEEYVRDEKVVHHITVVDGRRMSVAWQGVR